MLAVSLSADTGEMITVNNALETLSFRSSDYIDEGNIIENVLYGDDVAELKLLREVRREFDELSLRCGTCLFEVPLKRLAGVLFCSFVIGKLHGGITIFFYRTYLRNNTRPSFDDGAWNILSISTEDGSHSDFLSN